MAGLSHAVGDHSLPKLGGVGGLSHVGYTEATAAEQGFPYTTSFVSIDRATTAFTLTLPPQGQLNDVGCASYIIYWDGLQDLTISVGGSADCKINNVSANVVYSGGVDPDRVLSLVRLPHTWALHTISP